MKTFAIVAALLFSSNAFAEEYMFCNVREQYQGNVTTAQSSAKSFEMMYDSAATEYTFSSGWKLLLFPGSIEVGYHKNFYSREAEITIAVTDGQTTHKAVIPAPMAKAHVTHYEENSGKVIVVDAECSTSN